MRELLSLSTQTEGPDSATIAAAILDLVHDRGPGKTICPSEAARRLDPEAWRALMPAVREAAASLQAQGLIAVTQRGRPVDPLAAKGPIRLGLPPVGD
jgi:hypothetical protein